MKRKREDGRDEDEDDSRQRRDEAKVGEFEVNQEADDLEDEGEFQDYQEDVFDNRTGERFDAKLTKRAENEEMTHGAVRGGYRVDRRRMLGQDREGSRDHQVGSCEQGNIVKRLHQSQARGERHQDERRRILICSHAAS